LDYGSSWLDETWKMIREDKRQDYEWLLMVAPLARTPQDKKGGRALDDYAKRVRRVLDGITPWLSRTTRVASLRAKGEKGKIVVMLDSGDSPKDPLFKGAKTHRG
jgi:hypothetical protein